jgi:hypothetical protein
VRCDKVAWNAQFTQQPKASPALAPHLAGMQTTHYGGGGSASVHI